MADEHDFYVECMRLSAISTSFHSPSKSWRVRDPASTQSCGSLEASPQQHSIDDFELIKVIGRGSFAKVLMVELKRTKRVYAMKVIKKTKISSKACIDAVRAEKDVFLTASQYPFLVGLHSCFQTPSRLFFVMEFVRGGTLSGLVKRERRLPEEAARFYAAEISLALNFLHERGVIYRDLKLGNVLLDHEGHIKLTDYGLCKLGFAPGDTAFTMCGTPHTVAPEILNCEGYGFGVDWWALGVITYEMLVGRSPFKEHYMSMEYICEQILNKLIRIPSSLSPEAASVLECLLDRNPAERLACGKGGFIEIVNHPFFKIIDWEMLEQKRMYVPFAPELKGERDLTYFPNFREEDAQLTPEVDKSFDGFEYVNPVMASQEESE